MLVDDVYAHLNGYGSYAQGSSTYTLRMHDYPDTPDEVIAIMEFPAGPPIRAMGPSLGAPVRERAGLMILVRGPKRDVANARTVAETVYQRLDGLNASLSGRAYSIKAMHPPVKREQDRSARWEYEINFYVEKERG